MRSDPAHAGCDFLNGRLPLARQGRRDALPYSRVILADQPAAAFFSGASLRGNSAVISPITWPGVSPPHCASERLSGTWARPNWAAIFSAVVGRNGRSNTPRMRHDSARL